MSNNELFSLRWNDFQKNLSSGFHGLLEEGMLLDVTLGAGGQFVQAHKLVLSVCSSYFKDLFKVNPCKHPIVILKDVELRELNAILEFMYKGEVNVNQDDLPAFLKIAEMLKISGLTNSSDKRISAEREKSFPVSAESPRSPAISKRLKSGTSIHSNPTYDTPVPYKRYKVEGPTDPLIPEVTEEVQNAPVKMEPISIELSDDDEVEDIEQSMPPDELGSADDDSIMMDSGGISSEVFGAGGSAFAMQSSQSLDGEGPQDVQLQQGTVRFILSQRGQQQLVYNGYIYRRVYEHQGKTCWRCTRYDKAGCKARCTTAKHSSYFSLNGSHNHLQQTDEIEMKEKLYSFRSFTIGTNN